MGQVSFFIGLQVSQSLRGIFINQSIYALEMLKKYGLEQCDTVDILMVERSKLDEDPNGTPVDPTPYRGKAYRKALNYGETGCQDKRKSTSGGAQFLGEKLVSWSSKKQKYNAISTTKAETKHIAVCYHFIKEQVENEVVELYFVKTAYQLADVFTKAFGRERFEFLINRLGMQSIMPEELRLLAESEEEE
ncbi:hypothetical protein Tco_0780316 [Tanacetum coccineum]